MDPANASLVKTFGNTNAAALAASQLRSRGIECLVTSDDCGGMYPPLGVIKLLVDPTMAENAREILQEIPKEIEPPAEFQVPADSARPSVPPPRVYRFNSGLIVGLILGALIHFSYVYYRQHRDRSAWYDLDRDGVPDEEIIWHDGHMQESRLDRNGDGRLDHWAHYRDGVLLNVEADENFDGRPDYWVNYSPKRLPLTAQFDSDFNGIPDVFTTFTNGIVKQVDWRPNGTNVVLRRQFYLHGVLDEELRDFDGDGLFDISIKLDPFSNPIRTNNLEPGSTIP